MCDADTGIVTYTWLKHHYMPHPNFNVEHNCRDWDAVSEFAVERQVNSSGEGHNYFTRPEEGGWVQFDETPCDVGEVGETG